MEENKEPKKEESLIVNIEETYNYLTYLVGAMTITAEKDDGQGKREYIEKELLLRGVYPINPVKLEASKTGITVDEAKEKMKGWKASGNWELYKEKSIEIWEGYYALTEDGHLIKVLGDWDYVDASDWITFIINTGDRCCGSYGESSQAARKRTPLYLISDMAIKDLPDSLIQWLQISDGKIFPNAKQYLDFIDIEFKLKRKEEKK
jgi:hypothetical protein